MIKNPLISVVMPVYNVEQYLEASIKNVIAQDINFIKNIQLILINDGSTDNSYKICEEYQKLYPKNITYITQKNKGVSAARNHGLKEVKGKYVSFLDSDDKLSKDALRLVCNFFEANYDKIDLISIKQIFFDAKTGEHPLNYKYNKDKIIYVDIDYNNPQFSLTSAFIKTDIIKDYGVKFDTKLKYAEDAKFATEIIMKKRAYGVLSKPVHFYRKRSSRDSAINKSSLNYSWYFDTPKRCYQYLLNKYNNKTYPSYYIQYLVVYDLQYRIKQKSQNILSNSERDEYKELIFNVVKSIDDFVIINNKYLSIDLKIYLLSKKHKHNVVNNLERRKLGYYYKGHKLYDYTNWNASVYILKIKIKDEDIYLEGFVNRYVIDGIKIGLVVGNKFYPLRQNDVRVRYTNFLNEKIYGGFYFSVILPVFDRANISAFYYVNTGHAFYYVNTSHVFDKLNSNNIKITSNNLPIKVCRYSYISEKLFSYHIYGNYFLRLTRRGELLVRFVNTGSIILIELLRSLCILKGISLKNSLEKIVYEIKTIRFIQINEISINKKILNILRNLIRPLYKLLKNLINISYRLVFYLLKCFKTSPIWLIMDRVNIAGDNGEALYNYVLKQDKSNIKCYFVITKNSDDYDRIKKYGKVIAYGSLRYKLLFLLADKVISSHIDDLVINAFGNDLPNIIDLYSFDFIFLQHGIIHNDLSSWLNKYNKDIKLLVTSAHLEYDAVINGDYMYNKSIVKLTGMPRYDLLNSNPKNKIILAPTWRHYLTNEYRMDGSREYFDEFKKSDYFKFYNKLMNDPELLDIMNKYNMTGEFYLHPTMSSNVGDFTRNDVFKVIELPYSYKAALDEGSLLITDYSSLAFDFAYLKKPIIYSQFDKQRFFTSHTVQEGYFSYEKNGFGPVAYDYESTVREIIKQIKNGCRMQQKYTKRVEEFFAYTDRNNCKRVYEEIIKMDSI